MIKKLRRKFIIINMSLIFVVLMAVFSVLCYSSYQRYEADNMNALRRSLEESRSGTYDSKFEFGKDRIGKGEKSPFNLVPVFVVTLNDNKTIASIAGENHSTVTDSLASEAVTAALESGRRQGNLKSLSLRFLIDDTADGTKIAFADTTHESSSMRSLILTSLLILAGSMAAFFIISLFLAKWALTPVEKAWDQQNQFIADASHELKTPLTVILANLKILLSHKEDTISNQFRWIENTHTEASRMKKLVENLLFLARSESNTVPTAVNTFNLSDAVWSCLLPFESVAFEQGVTLNESVTPDLSMLGDEGQIKQLTAILLDNACKYAGKEKKVTVILEQLQEKARLSVNNTGEPIPPEELSHLFERFYRSDKSRARTEGGYGLGLSIAQTIVKKHRGRIQAESNALYGTTFTVWLPLNTADGHKFRESK